MNILNKFSQVEIKPDARISEGDRAFCLAHQNAYEKAREILSQTAELAGRGQLEQKEILPEDTISPYLGSDHDFGADKFLDELDSTHGRFVRRIVGYFRDKYRVSLDAGDIEAALIPKLPEEPRLYHSYSHMTEEEISAFKASLEEHKRTVEGLKARGRAMVIRYEDILEHIFTQLGGCSFGDVALRELKDKCHSAAWNTYRGSPDFEQKKSVISFTYMCSHDSWHAQWHKDDPPRFNLVDSMKNIIRGLNYFEMGSQQFMHYGLSPLLSYQIEGAEHEVGGNKIKSIKLFKKGRVDVRFQSEALAREFIEEFLGSAA